jgi:hypothetical protein
VLYGRSFPSSVRDVIGREVARRGVSFSGEILVTTRRSVYAHRCPSVEGHPTCVHASDCNEVAVHWADIYLYRIQACTTHHLSRHRGLREVTPIAAAQRVYAANSAGSGPSGTHSMRHVLRTRACHQTAIYGRTAR